MSLAAGDLARAVQDAVVKRRGGTRPSYMHCLVTVRKLLTVPIGHGQSREDREREIVAVATEMTL